ncbi:hypothetical protein BZG36_01558 [Bifiguratus adelaidae]|uniref:Autophagy-related protein 3 n=1 Tax=Bifiguratus adelaidae TaxID=1938954 RepID=A0A261Y3Z5_9FUNG|nr:hypothetical protein BZG36_01558 [Bifiguratus adelaidae]
MAMQDAYNQMFSAFQSVREYLAPVLKNSKFKETGCVTPEEFVAAGDFLVYKCPTWSWQSGDANKLRDYLPPQKQFLITRNVPCLRRVKQMEYTDDDAEEQVHGDMGDDDSWMYTHSSRVPRTISEIAHDISDDSDNEAEEAISRMKKLNLQPSFNPSEDNQDRPGEIPDLDDIPDIEDDEGGVEEEDDPAALTTDDSKDISDKILQVRTYDVFITYDKYYQTPRMWLFGYDEHRRPLTTSQIFHDVSQDYAHKTVTIETHPHLNMSLASIHPCKHAAVMKKIMERMDDGSGDEDHALRVDQYMIIFLKFMSSVVPTIDYDHTISA